MIAADTPLTVLHAPCHAPTVDHQALRFALSRRFAADAVGFSEVWRHEAFLRDREAWRMSMAFTREDDDRDTLRGKGDCPVLARRRYPLVDAWSMRACGKSVPIRIAHPRYFNGLTFAHDLGAVEVIAAHPHPAVRGLSLAFDRVEKYAQSMRLLELRIEQSLHRNRLPVVVGDLNYPDDGQAGPAWSPARMFARLGLRSWTVGVDWIAWHPRLIVVRNSVTGREETRQDHPWLLASFQGFR